MPSQPACFHRLDEILADLRSIESTHLDRRAVQKLFRVRQRRAQRPRPRSRARQLRRGRPCGRVAEPTTAASDYLALLGAGAP